MGGRTYTQAVSRTEGIKTQDQTNIGLLTLASESIGSLNLVEIATCILVGILCLYLLNWYCMRRRARKMQQIRAALQSVQIDLNVSICPVFQPPPVATTQPQMYPGRPKKSSAELLEAEVMARYEH